MRPRIVIVIEPCGTEGLEFVEQMWSPDELARQLTAAGADATAFSGRLEDAADASAYILLTDAHALEKGSQDEKRKARLARTIGAAGAKSACRLAESVGLLGMIDDASQSWLLSRQHASGDTSTLTVKRAVARQLGWELDPIHGTPGYAATWGIEKSLPQLILEYVVAAVGH